MAGDLYLVPNVLTSPGVAGNPLEVIPASALAITARLDYFIAENAKTARAFLKAVAQTHPLALPLQQIRIEELNVNTEARRLPELLLPLVQGGSAGLLSEAGVPAVADPGADLVRVAHARGIRIHPLVGPSSLLLALMASGLNGQSFAFNGYLPVDAGERASRIKALEQRSQQERQTQLFIETPYRNAALFEALLRHCRADTLICVATNLTLDTESIHTRTARQWKEVGEDWARQLQKQPTVFLFLAS
ncbi:SAM-dependent methyltransferase [Lacisediminimonas sp.]|uniref:SAM-dependent methyltransferase n=1 Tax=Lacisediminimonas sp. TaxID=3060582 RepID=UPI00271689A0|nr:SAM-dependent methyltransferase [Lacisediminimonas sp.]MDO8301359.1 SAM-dependent methyltransferase [Lacisediminimonas sp.]